MANINCKADFYNWLESASRNELEDAHKALSDALETEVDGKMVTRTMYAMAVIRRRM
jgi:hypothetical protein